MGSGSGKKEMDNKLRLAEKTHILNLSESGLKTTSSLWDTVAPIASGLKTLDISGNRLSDGLPNVLFSLVNVRSLNLSGCSLTTIPDISVLISVTNLKLDHNKLTADAIVSFPPGLLNLDLSNNHLEAFPLALIGHASLKELNLKDNKITDIAGIQTILTLTAVNCDNNFITMLPESVADLRSVRSISLAHNRFDCYSVVLLFFTRRFNNNSLLFFRMLPKSSLEGRQCIPQRLFLNPEFQSLNLEANTELSNKILLSFDGVEEFLSRRQKLNQKNLQGGGMVDFSVFGLP